MLVDGDNTYDAESAPKLVDLLLREALDMVNAARAPPHRDAAYPGRTSIRQRHAGRFGGRIFGNRLTDMLSGYRIFSHRLLKSFPALTAGFEIETEFTVHALELRLPIAEIPTAYRERPIGSTSKLRTYRDGVRILRTIVTLIKQEKPLQFFVSVGACLAIVSTVLAVPVIQTFLRTGLVPRLPTAVLSMGIMLLAFLSLTCGLVLETVTRGASRRKDCTILEYRSASVP